jgi:hypothetical protein
MSLHHRCSVVNTGLNVLALKVIRLRFSTSIFTSMMVRGLWNVTFVVQTTMTSHPHPYQLSGHPMFVPLPQSAGAAGTTAGVRPLQQQPQMALGVPLRAPPTNAGMLLAGALMGASVNGGRLAGSVGVRPASVTGTVQQQPPQSQVTAARTVSRTSVSE